jgi:hypothetical protein
MASRADRINKNLQDFPFWLDLLFVGRYLVTAALAHDHEITLSIAANNHPETLATVETFNRIL